MVNDELNRKWWYRKRRGLTILARRNQKIVWSCHKLYILFIHTTEITQKKTTNKYLCNKHESSITHREHTFGKVSLLSCDWYDPLPSPLAEDWQKWMDRASELDNVHLRRCTVGPPGKVLNSQLHAFADASPPSVTWVGRFLPPRVRSSVLWLFWWGRH